MKKLLLFGGLLIAIASCTNRITPSFEPTNSVLPLTPANNDSATLVVSESKRTRVQYTISEVPLQNPERGFASGFDPDDTSLEDTDLNEYYEEGVTLVYTTIRLDAYRESELPFELLQEISAYFASNRSSGVKSILRFAYNDGPYPDTEPDAPLELILRHIEQLTPILQNNADMIAWLEAGFIGAWGEWHQSTNGLDKDPDAKRQVMNALLSALPENRSVLLRYPVDIITYFPNPLSKETISFGSDQSRVGFHNDCFLATEDDQNTYARDGVFTLEEEFNYLKQSTQFVPVGGESCQQNSPRSDCPTALKELVFFHFTSLGDGWHPQVLSAWKKQGCHVEIKNRLGYRISLLDSTVNDFVSPGGILHLTVNLENTGFAAPINPRPVYLILDGSERFEVLLPVEARFWLPGKNSFNVKIRIPANAPVGAYDLAIWMPDPYETLMNNPRYSIAFANNSIWDADSAYNKLRVIRVDPIAGGDVDSTAIEIKVID